MKSRNIILKSKWRYVLSKSNCILHSEKKNQWICQCFIGYPFFHSAYIPLPSFRLPSHYCRTVFHPNFSPQPTNVTTRIFVKWKPSFLVLISCILSSLYISDKIYKVHLAYIQIIPIHITIWKDKENDRWYLIESDAKYVKSCW